MTPQVKTSPALVLAGRNGTFPIGPSAGIKDLWSAFMQDFGQIAGQVGLKAYGVCHSFDGKGQMDYLAAAEVEVAGQVPGYMFTLTIPKRKVAIFQHAGSLETISETWAKIFSDYLPAEKLTVAAGPQFEVYDGDAIEIHIPVK